MFLLLKVWFKNRRAKLRQQEKTNELNKRNSTGSSPSKTEVVDKKPTLTSLSPRKTKTPTPREADSVSPKCFASSALVIKPEQVSPSHPHDPSVASVSTSPVVTSSSLVSGGITSNSTNSSGNSIGNSGSLWVPSAMSPLPETMNSLGNSCSVQQKPLVSASSSSYAPALTNSLSHPGYSDTQHYNPAAAYYGMDYFSSMKFEKYPSLMTSQSMSPANFAPSSGMSMHNSMSSHMTGLNGMSSQLSNYGQHQAYASQQAINDVTPEYKDSTTTWNKFYPL